MAEYIDKIPTVEANRTFDATSDQSIIVDKSDPNNKIICLARAGTAHDVPNWKIFKVIKSGDLTLVKFANGSPSYVHVADDRLDYTFS